MKAWNGLLLDGGLDFVKLLQEHISSHAFLIVFAEAVKLLAHKPVIKPAIQPETG